MSGQNKGSAETLTHSTLRALFDDSLNHGDCVLVHSSLSSMGHINGGPNTLIEVLLEMIGTSGTLVMPTATTSFSKTRFFDAASSPSEMGLLTETFRQRPGTIRSVCPMASFAAFGPAADEFTRSYDSYLDVDSPFSALLENDGKVILYGVGYNKCTLYHLSEERLAVPYNAHLKFAGTVVDHNGVSRQGSQTYFVRKSLATRKDPTDSLLEFDNHPQNNVRSVNDSCLRVFSARAFDQFCMDRLTENPSAFLV